MREELSELTSGEILKKNGGIQLIIGEAGNSVLRYFFLLSIFERNFLPRYQAIST